MAACLGGAVRGTCISIVFPAERDNPFSVFLGLSVGESGSSAKPPITSSLSVVLQVWPLLGFAGVLLAMGLVWRAHSGDPGAASLTWMLLIKPATLGLVAPFALHESAHVLVLRRIRTVTHIAIERTVWRTSVIPQGTMTAGQTAVVALAGPGAASQLARFCGSPASTGPWPDGTSCTSCFCCRSSGAARLCGTAPKRRGQVESD